MEQSELYRNFILNAKTPYLIKDVDIPWSCFNISFVEWCELFNNNISSDKGEQFIEFEAAQKYHDDTPQFEKHRSKVKLNLINLVGRDCNQNTKTFLEENWIAYGYKNIEDIPEACRKGIDFAFLGTTKCQESMFWLSSKGANTPCHFDTYGCNIVVQVYGSKLWLLFPPAAKLTATRIPYEESSVYCKENFYSPNSFDQFDKFQDNCFKCILNPGDILIVPKHWWHYVESLEVSLSINTWLQLQCDVNSRLDECIVKCLIEKFTKNATDLEKFHILNPNENVDSNEENYLLPILKYLADQTLSQQLTESLYDYQFLSNEQFTDITKELNVTPVTKISTEEFLMLMQASNERYRLVKSQNKPLDFIKEVLINSLCNPKVIENVRNLFLKSYSKEIT